MVFFSREISPLQLLKVVMYVILRYVSLIGHLLDCYTIESMAIVKIFLNQKNFRILLDSNQKCLVYEVSTSLRDNISSDSPM